MIILPFFATTIWEKYWVIFTLFYQILDPLWRFLSNLCVFFLDKIWNIILFCWYAKLRIPKVRMRIHCLDSKNRCVSKFAYANIILAQSAGLKHIAHHFQAWNSLLPRWVLRKNCQRVSRYEHFITILKSRTWEI